MYLFERGIWETQSESPEKRAEHEDNLRQALGDDADARKRHVPRAAFVAQGGLQLVEEVERGSGGTGAEGHKSKDIDKITIDENGTA